MNKKRQKIFIRVICLVLAVLMAGSVLVGILASTAGAVTEEEIKRLQDELTDIQQQQKEIKSKINSLEYEQAEITAQKTVLDQRIALTQSEIDNLEEQIGQYTVLIGEKEQEVAEAQRREEEQWETYKVRIRSMEENGTVSYYAIIFGARDFSDMLSRIGMISSIIDYDEKLYNDLVDYRKATEQAKANLEATKAEAESKRLDKEQAQTKLEGELEEAVALIAALEGNIDEYNRVYAQIDEERDRLKDEIVKKQKEWEEQNRKVKGTGQFMWPVDSNVVTSGFGGRNTGIPGASTNHQGVDLKAPYGANIYASDTGTVITSARSDSYGEYVVIDHGNGYCTLYGHMSKRLVKVGDVVQKGQVIGLSGSTGIANGPHCHFEIWNNGTRVNPLNFFDSRTYVLR